MQLIDYIDANNVSRGVSSDIVQDGNGQNQDLGGTVHFADFLNLNAETGAISIAEYDDQAVWNKVMFKKKYLQGICRWSQK